MHCSSHRHAAPWMCHCFLPAAAGCCMVICTSQDPEGIVEILNGARKGTKFHPLANSLKGRKRWLLTGRGTQHTGSKLPVLCIVCLKLCPAQSAAAYAALNPKHHQKAVVWT